MNKYKLILGTMTFGPQVSLSEGKKMLSSFMQEGFNEIDTAYVYNDGKSEEILGQLINIETNSYLSIATKVNPRVTGKLDSESVNYQVKESLRRLNRDFVDILYLHFPDPNNPVEDALKACNELYHDGKVVELGLSNFPAWMVVDIWHLCEQKGWLKPTVYQGLYNGLSRNVEKELFPALRKLNIRFYAYNPLAGGLLSGRYLNFDENPSFGRFTERPNYRDRYWKKEYFHAIQLVNKQCQENDIEPFEAAYRWLAFNSKLSAIDNDGIVLGASSLQQLKKNILAIKKGPLPEALVTSFESAWNEVIAESPGYFRFYSTK